MNHLLLELLELLEDTLMTFGPGRVHRTPYRRIMHRLGSMKCRLENIKDGSKCPLGWHVADCHCQERKAA